MSAILHAAETARGGVGTVISQLAGAQAQSVGVHVICILPSEHVPEEFPSGVQLELYSRRGRDPYSLLKFAGIFVRTCLEARPRVVHLHSSFAGIIGRLLLVLLFPVYRPEATIYSPHSFSFMMNVGWLKKRAFAMLERFLAILADRIICVSAHELDCARDVGVPRKKLALVYNGVERMNAVREAGQRAVSDAIRVIFVGRLDRQKGFDVLIDAIRSMKNPRRINLIVVGEAVADVSIKNRVSAGLITGSSIRFTGWLPRSGVLREIETSDVLVIPSRWEGFAMVPLEAMALGVPVISSDACSLPEVVEQGHNGLLFPNEDHIALAKILDSVALDELVAMGRNALSTVRRKFSIASTVRGVADVYPPGLGGLSRGCTH